MGGKREKKWWGLGVFSPGPQNKEKTGGRKAQFELTKMPMCVVHIGVVLASCFLFFFFFLIFLWLVLFKKKLKCTYTMFLIKKCYFFVLINGDIIVNFIPTSFSILSFFFSTKQISFLSLHFSILPIKHKWEKTKSLLSSHFSILSSFSILPLFHSSNQMDPKFVNWYYFNVYLTQLSLFSCLAGELIHNYFYHKNNLILGGYIYLLFL